jgi:3-oxoacyl-[acyl-carrier-protein] synthase II
MRRACITGIGIVSPLGNCREATWQNVLAGRSGAAAISQFDATGWPTTFACEVKDFAMDEKAVFEGHHSYLNRPSEFGVQAAYEAIADSGALDTLDPVRFGVSIGAGIGAIRPRQLAAMLRGIDMDNGLRDLGNFAEEGAKDRLVLKNHPGTLAALLSARYQALGPITTIHTACASSGQSLGQALLQIRRGDCDVVLAGGADSLAGELLLAGFCLLGALSKRNDDPNSASRPFDRERDGFVASEGAAMLVIEELSRAKRRGATIYAELAGYGESESAYRITDMPENGRGIVEAMSQACTDGGIALNHVDYINAHGTSTELNDRVEALAIRRVFGARGIRPLVSSTKSEIGHLISAAGAMEAAFCVLAIRDQLVPPTRNLENTDCGEDIDFVAGEAKEHNVEVTLSNSIGFGGSNSVLAFKEYS